MFIQQSVSERPEKAQLKRLSLAVAIGGIFGLGNVSGSPLAKGPGSRLDNSPQLRFLARLERRKCDSGIADSNSAEIAVYDSTNGLVLVTNGADNAIDIFDINNPASCSRFDLSPYGANVQSVAVKHGKAVAVVAPEDVATTPGKAVFFNPDDAEYIADVEVGYLPDMVTFTPDGSYALVANEGEPRCIDDDPSNASNPEGSISRINATNYSVTSIDFSAFNNALDQLQARGVRVGTWPGATVAQDLEPEYIAVSPDGQHAYVTLQENNAVAEVDVIGGEVTAIRALGLKEHRRGINRLDASNDDGMANLRTWPVHGMYMPDAIAAWESGSGTLHVTANEGDGREYFDPTNDEIVCFTDETRVKDVTLAGNIRAPRNFAGDLQDDENLGRIKMSKFFPSTYVGGEPPTNDDDPSDTIGLAYTKLATFGARSISIWDSYGRQIWDSGDLLEQKVLARVGEDNWVYGPIIGTEYTVGDEGIDDRSDDKGPEPEAVAVGKAYGRDLIFAGLERAGGIMVFDATNPRAPRFLQWQQSADIAPEGLDFVPAADSPIQDTPLLIASYEVSGTTLVFRVVP